MKIYRGCAAGSYFQNASLWLARVRRSRQEAKRCQFQRRLKSELLETRQLLASDSFQHNAFDAENVNDDGECSPIDALLVIRELNGRDQNSASTPLVFTDVNNDGDRSPADALAVINRLNRRGGSNNPPPREPVIPSSPSEVRTFDGTGNNLNNTELGSTGEQLIRIAPADYADGVSSPSGADRANPRAISNELISQDPNSGTNDRDMSAFVYVWGQFIDHDISLTITPSTGKESLNIQIPAGDPFFDADGSGDAVLNFTRSSFDPATGTNEANPRQQTTEITAWIDGSMVYGSSQATADSLRTFENGQMIVSEDGLLPTNAAGMFLAGDVRANENIELTAIHTLFVREHNYWAEKILAANPSLTDEQVYQQARAIVIAEVQSITYNEWLPALLGRKAIDRYTGYDATTNPSVATEFSTAAFRLGHSLLQSDIEFLGNDGQATREAVGLADAFFNPSLVAEAGIDGLLKYAASAQSLELDNQIIDDVRNFLIDGPGGVMLDLAALNIQRGRDHGLADYNTTRVAYGLEPIDSFDDITSYEDLQAALEQVYGDVDNIDLWVGGLAEDHLAGSSVGELVQTIVADQFERLRDGDRFWYENIFSGRELNQLRNTKLSDIIQRNTTITNLQDDVFYFRAQIRGSVFMTSSASGHNGNHRASGVANVTLELLNDAGEVIETTVIDNRGQYKFSSIAEAGEYLVRVIAKDGTTIASAETLTVSVSRGDLRLSNLDFRLSTAI